jgi:hypothetical protein
MSDNSRTQIWDVYAGAIQTFDKKNQDYGDAWRRNGWRGNLSRVFEKADRVRNLVWRADPRVPAVGDEAAVETLQDMLNTIAFAIINLREEVEWGGEKPRSARVEALGEAYTPGVATSFFEQVGSELPHETQRVVHDTEQVLRTELIPHNQLQEALSVGTDEMRASEAENTGRVPRKPRQKAVADQPQA